MPYRWARRTGTPFTPLAVPLDEARVGVVTTATTPDLEPRALYAAPSWPTPPTMQTDHLEWHRSATHTDDVGSYLPLDRLRHLADVGVIGSLAPRFFGAPTLYSHRRTDANAATIGTWAIEDRVDLMLLVPL